MQRALTFCGTGESLGESYGRATTIDTLTDDVDDVLLEIFDFYRKNHNNLLLPRPVWE